VAYDYEDEPKPVRLTGPIVSAWNRVLVANEWFDGETYFQYGAQQRLIREWNENKPSIVTAITGWNGKPEVTRHRSRREAEQYADAIESSVDYITVRPEA
jgi:hypothetical protein